MNNQTLTGPVGERAYNLMRRMILRNELHAGVTIDEIGLASSLGFSRTPVREALIRLAAEGLVIREGRNLRVATIDVTDLRAFFEALEFLSRAVNRLAALNWDDASIQRIVKAHDAFDAAQNAGSDALSEANQEFHSAIGHAAQNEFIWTGYERTLNASVRLAGVCFARIEPDVMTEDPHNEITARQHSAIVAAITARDAQQADVLAIEHTELFRSRVMNVLNRFPKSLGDLSP